MQQMLQDIKYVFFGNINFYEKILLKWVEYVKIMRLSRDFRQ